MNLIEGIDDAPSRDEAFAEYGLAASGWQEGWRMLRTPRRKYVLWVDGRETLHHLDEDPWETRDRSGDPESRELIQDFREQMLRRLASTMAANNPLCPPIPRLSTRLP